MRAIDFGVRSDRGRARENNEDSFRVAPELGLFVLSDGMGGMASGEVASRLAADTVIEHCVAAAENLALPLEGLHILGASAAGDRLASAIRLANAQVRQAAAGNPSQQGMGATIVAMQLNDDRLIVAHVGDSRAYRLRQGELEQLTEDHSFVAEQVRRGMMTRHEAEQSKLQNVLLRALGPEPEVLVEVNEELLQEDDALLLCSDGLTKELSSAQISGALSGAEDAEEAAGRLVALANEAGGSDNITVIVIRTAPKPVGALARIGRWFNGSQNSSNGGHGDA
jgi:serine/threonine protein phosphatase PrpC